MPRVTRAALRSQPSPNVSEPAAAVSLPATSPISRRTPLGEISGNQEDLPAAVDNPERILKANKGIGKGKKGKGSKKSQIQDGAITKDKSADVLPDENESDTSSAVEDACQDLRKEQPEGKFPSFDI